MRRAVPLEPDVHMAFDDARPSPRPDEAAPRSTGAVDALGGRSCRCLRRERAPGTALFGIVQGGVYPDLRHRVGRNARRDRLRRLRGRRPRGRRGAGDDVATRRGDTPHAPDATPALPHGCRHAGGHHSAPSPAASTCSTASSRPAPAAPPGLHERRRFNLRNARFADDSARSMPPAPVPCTRHIRAYLHHLFRRERRSARCCSPGTTSSTIRT